MKALRLDHKHDEVAVMSDDTEVPRDDEGYVIVSEAREKAKKVFFVHEDDKYDLQGSMERAKEYIGNH